MATQLKWVNRNRKLVTTRIYRSTAPFTEANLPSILAVLSNNETSYVDTSADGAISYTYLISFDDGNEVVFGEPITTSFGADTGIGPTTLISGDMRLGYYGKVTSMPYYQTLQTMCGLPISSSVAAESAEFHKFVRNGKILIIPDSYIGTYTYETLFTAGAVFGDGAAHSYLGVSTVQDNVVRLSNRRYKVRLLTGISDTALDIQPYIDRYATEIAVVDEVYVAYGTYVNNFNNPCTTNEFDDLYYPFGNITAVSGSLAPIGSTYLTNLRLNVPQANYQSGHQQRILIQETTPSFRKQLVRLGANKIGAGTGTVIVYNSGAGATSRNLPNYWVPVFELIED